MVKKMKGGKLKNKSRLQKDNLKQNIITPFNLILLGIIVFLIYQMTNNETIVKQVIYKKNKPKVIIKEVIKNEQPYKENTYIPDRVNTRKYPPFNIRTRGPPEEFNMVGFLQDSEDSNKLQQLYGRRTYPNSNNWNYFVKSDQYHQIPIPVSIAGQNCSDERGCTELNDKDKIIVLNKEHTANIYQKRPIYYDPFNY